MVGPLLVATLTLLVQGPPTDAGHGRRGVDEIPSAHGDVLIGYFGPSDPADPEGGDMWRAARLAVEEANQEGGYRGKPFRLVPGWSENPWGTGVVQVTRMVFHHKVWAIVGGIDGPSTHLAEQVVAKARLTLIGPVSTDRSVNLANVPWMFSCAPGDHRLAEPLAAELAARCAGRTFVVVSTDDHDPRMCTAELRKALDRTKKGTGLICRNGPEGASHKSAPSPLPVPLVPRYQYECRPGVPEVDSLSKRVVAANPAAVGICPF